MATDLSLDHKMIDGLIIYTESGVVVNQNGKKLGALPKGSVPTSGSEILAKLNIDPVKDKPYLDTKKEAPKKSFDKPKKGFGLKRG